MAPERITRYTDWFFNNHIEPHFELEEKHMFPILEEDETLVKKVISEHRRLGRLFQDTADISKSLSLVEKELERHIRFEERILFNEIQKVATEKQIKNFLKPTILEAEP